MIKIYLPLLLTGLLAAFSGQAQDLKIAEAHEGNMRFIPYDSGAYIYDANGRVTEQSHYYQYPPEPLMLNSRAFMTYNADGSLQESLSIGYNETTVTDSHRTVHTYNSAGKVLTTTRSSKYLQDSDWKVQHGDTFTYQSDTILKTAVNWVTSSMEVYGYRHDHTVDMMGRDTLIRYERWFADAKIWRNSELYQIGYTTSGDTSIVTTTISVWDNANAKWSPYTRYHHHYWADTLTFYAWEQWINNTWEIRGDQRTVFRPDRQPLEYYSRTFSKFGITYGNRIIYSYNTQGKQSEVTTFLWDEDVDVWQPEARSRYTYTNGHATSIETSLYNGNWQHRYMQDNVYKDDLLVSQRNRRWLPGSSAYELESFDTLTYDIHQNLILRHSESPNDTSEDRYYYKLSIGIAKVLSLEVSVYPNPFSDKLRVQIPSASGTQVSLQLYDLNGRSVMNQTLRPASDNAIEISTTGLPAGVFLLRIATDTGTHTQRVVHVK